MSPVHFKKENIKKWTFDFLKHPLFLFAVGAMLSYILVPMYNDYKLRKQRRKELVYELSKFDSELMARENLIYTQLSMLRKDLKSETTPEYLARKKAMQEATNALYMKFDEIAWSGLNNLRLRFLWNNAGNIDSTRLYFDSYKDNIKDKLDHLSVFWDAVLRSEKLPDPALLQKIDVAYKRHADSLRGKQYILVEKLINGIGRPDE